VTVTSSNSTSTEAEDDPSSSSLDSQGGNNDNNSDRVDQRLSIPSPPNQSTNRPKSNDQEIEENILTLQSEVQQHFRHAAYSAALATAGQLLELTSSHFGPLHPATASAHNNVGLMNKLLGNYDEAREAYHESLRVYGEVCGKDHASYAAALSNLGMLERGRVLESEAMEGEGDDDDDDAADGEVGSDGDNEDEVELDELRDGNATAASANPTKMSAMERMQLNESAIEYFDESHRIRLSELGPDHPHTIASRSQLGSAMAAAVVAERKGRIGGLVEAELRRLKRSKDVGDAKEMETYVPEAIARAAAKSTSGGSKLTRRRWEAAEEHLRGALETAVENPRGESVGPLVFVPVGSADSPVDDKETERGGGLTLPLKKDRSLSKKDRKRLEKERKREKRQANANTIASVLQNGVGSASTSTGNKDRGVKKMAVQGTAGKVTTLSAATAAQNLAVFLKNYADWLRLTLMDESSHQSSSQKGPQPQISELNQTIQEARHLYEAALHVRSSILPPHHPEVVASKFSLAELLDAPTAIASAAAAAGANDVDVLDKQRANDLREEILNAYNVEEIEQSGDNGSGSVANSK